MSRITEVASSKPTESAAAATICVDLDEITMNSVNCRFVLDFEEENDDENAAATSTFYVKDENIKEAEPLSKAQNSSSNSDGGGLSELEKRMREIFAENPGLERQELKTMLGRVIEGWTTETDNAAQNNHQIDPEQVRTLMSKIMEEEMRLWGERTVDSLCDAFIMKKKKTTETTKEEDERDEDGMEILGTIKSIEVVSEEEMRQLLYPTEQKEHGSHAIIEDLSAPCPIVSPDSSKAVVENDSFTVVQSNEQDFIACQTVYISQDQSDELETNFVEASCSSKNEASTETTTPAFVAKKTTLTNKTFTEDPLELTRKKKSLKRPPPDFLGSLFSKMGANFAKETQAALKGKRAGTRTLAKRKRNRL